MGGDTSRICESWVEGEWRVAQPGANGLDVTCANQVCVATLWSKSMMIMGRDASEGSSRTVGDRERRRFGGGCDSIRETREEARLIIMLSRRHTDGNLKSTAVLKGTKMVKADVSSCRTHGCHIQVVMLW